MRKNVASQTVAFQAVSTTDGSAVTTGTPSVYYTIDGGAQGSGAGAIVHEGNGCWSYTPAQAETNGSHIVFTFVLSGAVNQSVNIYTITSDLETLNTSATISGNISSISTDTGTSIPASLATLSSDVAGVDGIVSGNAAILASLNDPTSAAIADAVWTEILADHSGVVGSVAEALSNAGGGGNVTVGDITAAALAKFVTTDTLETTAAAGSVAKIAQGAAGGNVTVGTFTTAALAQMVTDDTGETAAASGSVAELSKSAVGGSGVYQITVTVQDASLDPVQGARVNVDGTALTATTNVSGQVILNLDAGSYSLNVAAPTGYDDPAATPITVSADDSVTIAITGSSGSSGIPWIG